MSLALEFVTRLGHDLQDQDHPPEAHQLGLKPSPLAWCHEICAWHTSGVSNAPTEAINNLIKRVKRVAFGIVNHRNYHIRALLYAGKPALRKSAGCDGRA